MLQRSESVACCAAAAVLACCRAAMLPCCRDACLDAVMQCCRPAILQCCRPDVRPNGSAALLPCCQRMLPCCRAAALPCSPMLPCGGKRRRMPHARVVRQAPLPRFAVIPAAPNPPNQTGQPDWPTRVASPIISGVHRYRASLKSAPISVSISQYTDIGVNIANKKLGTDCGDEKEWSDDDAQSARR
jgi:hypothetical protein